MKRYYFHIRNDKPFIDVDGLEMPDIHQVRIEAIGFARDMMRLEPGRREWPNCAVYVTDENKVAVLEVNFREAAGT